MATPKFSPSDRCNSPPEGHNAGYKDTAKLKLPFSGQWFVYQGGHGVFDNAYQVTDDQQFAVDFVLLKNGSPFEGDATQERTVLLFWSTGVGPRPTAGWCER